MGNIKQDKAEILISRELIIKNNIVIDQSFNKMYENDTEYFKFKSTQKYLHKIDPRVYFVAKKSGKWMLVSDIKSLKAYSVRSIHDNAHKAFEAMVKLIKHETGETVSCKNLFDFKKNLKTSYHKRYRQSNDRIRLTAWIEPSIKQQLNDVANHYRLSMTTAIELMIVNSWNDIEKT